MFTHRNNIEAIGNRRRCVFFRRPRNRVVRFSFVRRGVPCFQDRSPDPCRALDERPGTSRLFDVSVVSEGYGRSAGVRRRTAVVRQPYVRHIAGHQERERFGVRRLHGLRTSRKGERCPFFSYTRLQIAQYTPTYLSRSMSAINAGHRFDGVHDDRALFDVQNYRSWHGHVKYECCR